MRGSQDQKASLNYNRMNSGQRVLPTTRNVYGSILSNRTSAFPLRSEYTYLGMSKRKKSAPARKEDGTSLHIARTLRKKHFQSDKDQNTDTTGEECKITTEQHDTEDVALKPREDKEPITISHNLECKKQRTDLTVPAVEEKVSRVNMSQEEHLALALSQNSAGRYVPVFPKPKNRLIQCDSSKNVMVKPNKESANVSKTEGDDSSHNLVLESSGFCLAATEQQVQASQQPSEQIALNSSHLVSNVSEKEQQETRVDEDCIHQGSKSSVSLSRMQEGTDFVDHAIEGLTCYSDSMNSAVTEVRQESSQLHEMVVLCSTPIPVAPSTAFEQPLTQSQHRTLNLSSSFSKSERLHHSLYQEINDKGLVTHEELAISQNEQTTSTIAINNTDQNVESRIHTPEVLRNFSYGEKIHNVVCEGIDVNKQEAFTRMTLVTDPFAQSDLKETTCSRPADLSLDTNAENQLETFSSSSQANIIDEHQNVNEKLPMSPRSVRNFVSKNYDDYQKDSNGNWSDVNVSGHSVTEMTDNIILPKDSVDQDVKSKYVSEIERIHPGDQTENDMATNHKYQKIILESYETFHGCGGIEGCNSVNCGNASEETKLLIQETLSENQGKGAISTHYAEQKCNSFAQCQGSVGEQCIGHSQSQFLETQLADSILDCSQTDMSKSLVDFKVCTRNCLSSEPEHLESDNTVPQQLGTNITPLQAAICPAKNEEIIPDNEINHHQIHFSNGNDTEITKEQIVSKISLATTEGIIYNTLSSFDKLGFQTRIHVSGIKDPAKVDLSRREINHDVVVKQRNEDVIASLQLPGSGIEKDATKCHQKGKVKKQIQDEGNMECGGGTNYSDGESSVEEHMLPSLMGQLKEEESLVKYGTSDQIVYSVEEMDLQLGYDFATGDKNTVPRSPNLTTISVVSSQYKSEDVTARHRGPTSNVETAKASVHTRINAETGHRINNVNECKGYGSPLVNERSSSKTQERINAQHASTFWTENQKDKSEQNPWSGTNCKMTHSIYIDLCGGAAYYSTFALYSLLGLTDLCEQAFSVMNINKASHRSKLTDQHLRSILRIATTKLNPDFDALAKKGDQQHCSH
ncbi:uncharacterized protein LOC132406380 [Hypanus sabinus]|uniref:uncharacterized protein LOC132406380 n=1 Tax=Hypanus sabinus TaxID=79690 RepID=UPI0028C384ED|nr:uncharacterized protein LOC132406380 [Hypanus sabinus]